jgi:hypothetical protein
MAGTIMFFSLKVAVACLNVIKVLSVPVVPFFDILAALAADGKVIKVAPQLKVCGSTSTATHALTVFGLGTLQHITA